MIQKKIYELTSGASNTGREPYCEFYASQIYVGGRITADRVKNRKTAVLLFGETAVFRIWRLN